MTVLRGFYELFFFVFALFYLPVFYRKGKWRGLPERLGAVPPEARRQLAGRKVVWIHAVSVGEVVQGFRLGQTVKSKFSGAQVLLTVTTTAAREVAERMRSDRETVLYFPVDFRWCVRRFIDAVRPSAVLITETEIWPNLICELKSKKVPAFIVGGRISDRAFPKYRRIAGLLKPFLRQLDGIGVQTDTMRQRFLALGADPEKVFLTGNMKYDWAPGVPEAPERDGNGLSPDPAFLFVAGSTHAGEETVLLEVAGRLQEKHPGFLAVLAPRHLERLPAVEEAAAGRGLAVRRAPVFKKELLGQRPGRPEVLLVDRMGTLADWYRAADAVFIGGSLVPFGGHNPVEAAYYGKPILFGPSMENFKEMADEFLRAAAAVQVNGAGELEERLIFWMNHREARDQLGSRARAFVRERRGASERNIETFLTPLNL